MSPLIKSIQESENFYSLGAANQEDIAGAQERLGLFFAEEYNEYLATFGVATFKNHELTGICNSERLNVVDVTQKARVFFPVFSHDFYVVEELLIDRIVIVQNKDGKVYSCGPETPPVFLADSLQEYYFPMNVS